MQKALLFLAFTRRFESSHEIIPFSLTLFCDTARTADILTLNVSDLIGGIIKHSDALDIILHACCLPVLIILFGVL